MPISGLYLFPFELVLVVAVLEVELFDFVRLGAVVVVAFRQDQRRGDQALGDSKADRGALRRTRESSDGIVAR